MRLKITFTEDERAKVNAVVAAVKTIFHSARVHGGEPPKDGRFRLEMRSD